MLKASSLPCRRAVDFLGDFDTLHQLAKTSGFLQRAPRKVTPGGFVKAVMLAGASGSASFNAIAWQTGRVTGETSSRQNLHRRCDESAVRFLEAVSAHALQSRIPFPSAASGLFNRVLIHDGSLIRLSDALSEHFPAVSSAEQHLAMLRLQFAYDLTSGQTLFARFGPYPRTDGAAAGDLLEHLRPGDLCLRDLGYYKAEWFQQMEAAGAFYVSRLKSEVTIVTENGSNLRLDRFLSGMKGPLVDQRVRLGRAGDFHTRLVALRVPPEVAAQRRRKLHEKAKKKGETVSALKLALADWVLLITNLTKEQADAETLRQLYRLRWHVEIVFKTFKSNGCMRLLTSYVSNPHHLQVLLLGQLLQVILNLRLWRALAGNTPEHPSSLLKMAGQAWETLEALWFSGRSELLWKGHLRRLLYYCRYDRRRLKSLATLHAELLR